jgi:hypothetical protein
MNLLCLNDAQKILFYSAMSAIIVQMLCIFCLLDKKQEFKLDRCLGYIFFSAIAYIFYYQLVIPK